MMDLEGKVALVTGSSRGIGASIALKLAECGANVAVNYLENSEAANKISSQIEELGCKAISVQADVSKYEDAHELVNAVEKTFGRLDILVNNVGDFVQKPLSATSTQEWQYMFDSNLHSTFNVCYAALPGMRSRNQGRIVNTAFANSAYVQAYKKITPYAIAKTGVIIYTKSLAKEEAENGITVNVVSPGFISNETIMGDRKKELEAEIPAGRVGETDDVANAVLFLVSDASAYITGTNIIVSGGWGI